MVLKLEGCAHTASVYLVSRTWEVTLLNGEAASVHFGTQHAIILRQPCLTFPFLFVEPHLCYHFGRLKGRFGDPELLMHEQQKLLLDGPWWDDTSRGFILW